jgi:hypothetical protein
MKPTAYVLFLLSVVLAVSAVLLNLNSTPYASGSEATRGEPGGSSTLIIALFATAAAAAALGWAMLRFGGKGYTETNLPMWV